MNEKNNAFALIQVKKRFKNKARIINYFNSFNILPLILYLSSCYFKEIV